MRHLMTTDSANIKRQKNEQKANASKKTNVVQRLPQADTQAKPKEPILPKHQRHI